MQETYPSCKRVFFRPETSRSPRITSGINGRRNAWFPWNRPSFPSTTSAVDPLRE
jgi:hypothetical protein